jgi:hypothetical protein
VVDIKKISKRNATSTIGVMSILMPKRFFMGRATAYCASFSLSISINMKAPSSTE